MTKFIEKLFFIAAIISVVAVLLIMGFVFFKGFQPFFSGNAEGTYSFIDFITGLKWNPSDDPAKAEYGILYMIVGSILGTLGAIVIGVPIGIFTAAYITELASERVRNIIKPAVLLLAGIPSVIYGLFGLGVIVPLIKTTTGVSAGQSLLAVIIVLTLMILPTIIAISESAIAAVPKSYKQGAYALGASKVHTTMTVVVPAAKRGILVGVVLGVGRAIGEAMAVMLVAGNPGGGLPDSILSPVRPLTTNVVLEMGYAFGLHQEMLFATGAILLLFIMMINIILNKVTSKMEDY